MDATMEEVKGFIDREKIRDCLARLARGEDRRDARLIGSSYWQDAACDYGVFKGNFDEYLAWVVPGAPAITNSQHVLGQSVIEVNGERACVETHVISYHRVDMGTEERDTVIGGRYLDRMEKRGGEWRIAHRTMLYDWYQDWGRSIDWSQGLMGQALSAGHFSGRAHKDFSEIFFGGKSS